MLKELGIIFLIKLKKALQYKYFWLIIFFIIILISYIRINLNNKSSYNGKENEFKLVIIDKKYQNDKYIITLKGKERLITKTKDFPYDIGDIVIIKGKLEKVSNNTIPDLFNYQKYLQSRKIYWQLKIDEVKLVKSNSNLWYKIKNKVTIRIESMKNKEYLYAFLLGNTSYFSDEVRDKYQINGLSYVLAIGSLQVMMIIKGLEKIEEKLKMKKRLRLVINTLIIILYILFTSCAIGILRSGLCYILKKVLSYKKIKFKYYNIIILIGIFLLLVNPFYINNIGFLYSFFISLGISLLRKRIKGNYSKRLITISFIAFIISLPITIYSNYEINFLSILYGFLLVPVFTFLIFPLSIIVFIFPFISGVFSFIVSFIEYIINIFSKVTFLTFVFRKPSLFLIIVYYIVVILFFYQKRYHILLVLLLLFHHNTNYIIKEDIITFLDVKEGDAILIKSNNSVNLIDTGGNNYTKYSDEIIKYIKSLGGFKINNMILTHGDFDHMGEAINIINNFKVEKVIFNCGEFNDLEQELIKVLDEKKIKYYSCIKELNIDNNKLCFLNTGKYNNENDNSNVIYTEINNYKFLFMGDASKIREKDILDKYNLSDIDVLKVGHHGSKTSSSKSFINEINPRYSIISVGKNNWYGHPNKEALDNLKDSKIYRTDEDGSIMFKVKNNQLKIETCSP